MSVPTKRDFGSLIISLVFVATGVVTLYDTAGYTDMDSKIFPRAAAIALIIAAGISCVMWMVWPTKSQGFGNGTWWRRILLVSLMLIAALAMPKVGFLPAGILVFVGGLLAGMEERWNIRNIALYAICSVVIVTAFYSLFKYALHVPLP